MARRALRSDITIAIDRQRGPVRAKEMGLDGDAAIPSEMRSRHCDNEVSSSAAER